MGVFCFLVILSVMNGFVGELKSYLTSMEPQVEISYSSNSIFKDINEIIPSFNKFDENIEYHNSYIQEDVILKYSNENATLIKLRGIDINSKNEISMIKNHILVGDYKNIYEKKSNVPPIFLGKDLILGLNLNIDSIVTIIKAEDAGNIEESVPKQYPFIVKGILSTGTFIFDKKIAITSFDSAKEVFPHPSSQKKSLTLKNPFAVNSVKKSLEAQIAKYGLKTRTWIDVNHSLVTALKLEKIGMTTVNMLILIVGCFSISIALVLGIRRKTYDIAVLKSLGLQNQSIAKMFIFYGLIEWFLGLIIGLSFGFLVLYLLSSYPILSLVGFSKDYLIPIEIHKTDIFLIIITSFFITVFLSIWPSLKASKLNVSEVLSKRL